MPSAAIPTHAGERVGIGVADDVNEREHARDVRGRGVGLGRFHEPGQPQFRHALLKVLLMPDSERATLIGELGSNPPSPSAAELLIGCEEDRTLRAVLVRMLREIDR